MLDGSAYRAGSHGYAGRLPHLDPCRQRVKGVDSESRLTCPKKRKGGRGAALAGKAVCSAALAREDHDQVEQADEPRCRCRVPPASPY